MGWRRQSALVVRGVKPPARGPWRRASPAAISCRGVLAALAVADTLGVSAERSLEVVREFVPYPGRLRPLKGRRGTTVLDDSYSASAPAVLGAVETLKAHPAPRAAVLGDMDELGPEHERTHRLVGERLAPWVDLLVAVGSGGA